jgi:hypothetical protein
MRARHAVPRLLVAIGLAGSFNVAAASAVTISGSPPTSVAAGKLFSFTPTVSISARRHPSFTIANKPAWASFSASTGALSGTPVTSNIGTTSGIGIKVTDGRTSAQLPPFSITVTGTVPATTGTATLTWLPPTQNSDGSALTNLAGYEVDYGTAANALNKTLTVANPAQSSFTVANLASGTWYFAVKAYTNSGLQSALSTVGSKSIP